MSSSKSHHQQQEAECLSISNSSDKYPNHTPSAKDPLLAKTVDVPEQPSSQSPCPSIYHVFIPYSIFITANSLYAAPFQQFVMERVCAQVSPQMSAFSYSPDALPAHCLIPEVQSESATWLMLTQIAGAIPSLFLIGFLGKLSDVIGRRPIMILSIVGCIFNLSVYVLVEYCNWGLSALIPAALVTGCTGMESSMMTAINAYLADVTTREVRSSAYGQLSALLYLGVMAGPLIGGYIVKVYGNNSATFITSIIANILVLLYLVLFLPESLRKSHHQKKELPPLCLNLFKTFSVFFEHRNLSLMMLAGISFLVNMAAIGVVGILLLYGTLKFGWGTYDDGIVLSLFMVSKLFFVAFLLPILVKTPRTQKGKSRMEIWLFRSGYIVNCLSVFIMGMSQTAYGFIAAGMLDGIAGMGLSVVRGLMSKMVDGDSQGRLWSAVSAMGCFAQILSPIIFNNIYAQSVSTQPNLVFFIISGLLAVVCALSVFVSNDEPTISPPSSFDQDITIDSSQV